MAQKTAKLEEYNNILNIKVRKHMLAQWLNIWRRQLKPQRLVRLVCPLSPNNSCMYMCFSCCFVHRSSLEGRADLCTRKMVYCVSVYIVSLYTCLDCSTLIYSLHLGPFEDYVKLGILIDYIVSKQFMFML